MRLSLICVVTVTLLGLAIAQTPAPQNVRLAGDRFPPLTYDQMTPAQKALTEHILSGERRSMNGPFNVLLRSPEMGDLAQKFGAQARFHSSLPNKLNEFAILITARFWTVQYEWQAHRRAALKAGLSPAVIDAVAVGKRPPSMAPEEAAVYDFCHELLTTKQVRDATFQAAIQRFGERGVVDLLGLLGWYNFVSMLLNVDRYPLPDGVQPELKPLP